MFYFLPLNTAESVHFIKKYLDFIMLAEPHLCGKSKNLRLFERNLKTPQHKQPLPCLFQCFSSLEVCEVAFVSCVSTGMFDNHDVTHVFLPQMLHEEFLNIKFSSILINFICIIKKCSNQIH